MNFVIIMNNYHQLFGWGRNNFGQLGLGHKKMILKPTSIDFFVKEGI